MSHIIYQFYTQRNLRLEYFSMVSLSDIIKLVCFPLSYLMPARGAAKAFILTELVTMLTLLTCTYVILPFVKIEFASLGFVAMYAIYMPIVWFIPRRRLGSVFRHNKKIILSVFIFILIIIFTKSKAPEYIMGVSILSAILHTFYSLSVSNKLFLIVKYLRMKRKSLRAGPP